MNPAKFLTSAAAALAAVFLVSCADKTKPGATAATAAVKDVNPFPPGTYDHFKAEKTYPKTSNVWKNDELLAKTDESNSHVLISLSKQRGYLMNGEEVAIDYPICSGIASRPTPLGTFNIQEKVVDKKSNKYGRIYDAGGECVNGNADMGTDKVPEGGHFEGAGMRYWMRLTGDGVGHHIGPVKRYPASHACIRGPSAIMPIVYSKMKVGSTIKVED
jgi:hypothetical protein